MSCKKYTLSRALVALLNGVVEPIYAMLVDGIIRKISVKLFLI